ncbi:bile acid:sodium symporter family protein [Cellulomonas sp. S1-8]|uniref:bile acid:sodium symporter family protein n=1 Tax=Cellulomonas sp. S1-8 TaxID=2904790 RepID=UPI0022431B8B|nr:bile acid:sodium symporter family protein [Cellulomonas sp. S1-8]UZN02960.1 bile acid:sodium symporter [Cellulomonas sp. S1-8]
MRAPAWLRWLDPLTVMIVAVLVLGLLVPVSDDVGALLDTVRTVAIVLLFFLYGARMPTREVVDGLRRFRLQGSMLAATFLLFPLLGLAVQLLPDAVLAPDLQRGLLYLSVLPSTVQSSVVMTSIARGNVAGAITGATISNVLGVLLTPLLVAVLLGATGAGLDGSAVTGILLQLLLPFVVGQCVQPWIGAWLRRHGPLTRVTDRSTILLVVFTSVSEAQAQGAWDDLTVGALAVLLVVCAVVLTVMLVVTWRGGAALGLDRGDRIALLMCGSKKSAATGLPMAAVLFAPAVAASVALPVIAFHQLQIVVCAVLARRLAASAPPDDPA